MNQDYSYNTTFCHFDTKDNCSMNLHNVGNYYDSDTMPYRIKVFEQSLISHAS